MFRRKCKYRLNFDQSAPPEDNIIAVTEILNRADITLSELAYDSLSIGTRKTIRVEQIYE